MARSESSVGEEFAFHVIWAEASRQLTIMSFVQSPGTQSYKKDTNNISCTVRYGLEVKARLVRNLPFMQIFVIWAKASWQLTI